MKLEDNIDKIIDRNSAAYLSLTAFRESAQRFFGIEHMPLVQSQDVKRWLRTVADTGSVNKQTQSIYPFAYFNITRIGIERDNHATKTIARAGRGQTFDQIENAFVTNAYMFPATISVEMHYLTNDLIRAIDFATRAVIVAATGKLNTKVQLNGAEWFVTSQFNDYAVDFPRPDKDMEEDPEAFDLTINCDLKTNLGVMRAVPKVNNRGHVTTSTKLAGDK